MPIRALVVDDSLQLRRSVVNALQSMVGCTCVEAGDGAEAVRQLQHGTFDVVLSDVNMPVLDGLKLVAYIRGEAAHAALPIVMMTTQSAEVDRRRALRLGANAYLVKPLSSQVVVDTVKRLLGVWP
jgi:two-component system chemotaxis response regulator CheY